MGLKLNGATSGSIEIDVPAVAGTDTAITIPATTGGEFIVSDSSGNIDLGPLDINGGAADDSVNIDGSGRLLVGTNSALSSGNSQYAKIQTLGNTAGATGNARVVIGRGEAATDMSSGNSIGEVNFTDNTSAEFAQIQAFVDGTPGTNDYPGRLVFSTTANAASSPTERMRIDNQGFVGIGGVSPTRKFHVHESAASTNSYVSITNDTTGSTGSDGFQLICLSDGGAVLMQREQEALYLFTDGTERMKINSVGELFVYDVYNSTTASAANVVVASTGRIVRSTSSGKYKTDIETLQDQYADALLDCRPVWYRSICEGDNPNYGWWGFIAEEVAEIDPRLVHWKTTDVTYDETGSAVETPCDPEPEGVAYDRFVPHLLNLIKRQKEQLETQAASIASLETRLTALEGGAA